MSLSRFLYTDCSGLPSVDNSAGFGVQAADTRVDPKLKNAALEKMLYQPASKLRQQNAAPEAYPPSFVFDSAEEWLLISKGWNYGAAQGAARGGNQVTTVWWTADADALGSVVPAQLYAQDEGWENQPADSAQLAPVETPLVESDEFELETVQEILHEQDQAPKRLAGLLGGIREALRRNMKLVVITTDDGSTAAKWLTAATSLLPQEDQLKATFRIFADSAQRPQQRIAVVNPELMQSPASVATVSAGLGLDLHTAQTKEFTVDEHSKYAAERFFAAEDAYEAQEEAQFYLRWCGQIGSAAAAPNAPEDASLEDVLTALIALTRASAGAPEESWEREDFDSFSQELVDAAMGKAKAAGGIHPVAQWAEAAAACVEGGFTEGSSALVYKLAQQLEHSVGRWHQVWQASELRHPMAWTDKRLSEPTLEAFLDLFGHGSEEKLSPAMALYDQLGLEQVAGDQQPLIESMATRVLEQDTRIPAETVLGNGIRTEVTKRLEAKISTDTSPGYTMLHSGQFDTTLALLRDAHREGSSAISSELVRTAAIARLEFLPRVSEQNWDRAEQSARQVAGHYGPLMLRKHLSEECPMVLPVWLRAHPNTLQDKTIHRRTERLLYNRQIDANPQISHAVGELIRVLNGPAVQYLPREWVARVDPRHIAAQVWPTQGPQGSIGMRPDPQTGERVIVKIPTAVVETAVGLDPQAFINWWVPDFQADPEFWIENALGYVLNDLRGQYPNLAYAVVSTVDTLFDSWDKKIAKEWRGHHKKDLKRAGDIAEKSEPAQREATQKSGKGLGGILGKRGR